MRTETIINGPFRADAAAVQSQPISGVVRLNKRGSAFSTGLSIYLASFAAARDVASGINAALDAHEKPPTTPYEVEVDLHEDVAPDLFKPGETLRIGWEWGTEGDVSVVFVRAYDAGGAPIVLTSGIESRILASDFVQRALDDARVEAAVAERERAMAAAE
ncbi:hypothetical protein ACTZWW_04390 [Salinarimonas sp. NSM]|uniref:hypothetical protein n=1 Tax=Salinarimonas sp. NSM TaxID=3458003 RepID=UPI004035629E